MLAPATAPTAWGAQHGGFPAPPPPIRRRAMSDAPRALLESHTLVCVGRGAARRATGWLPQHRESTGESNRPSSRRSDGGASSSESERETLTIESAWIERRRSADGRLGM